MAKKDKETKDTAQQETAPEGQEVTLNLGELRGIAEIMIQGAANLENLSEQQARNTVMQETWELTQLLIKKEVRECRNNVNNQLLQFFQTFPEALEPIKNQVFPQVAPSEEE